MKLPLAYYGDPVLRQKAAEVEGIDDELRQLVTDMIETMHGTNGMGLAAPQVHRSIRVFLVQQPIPGEDEDSWKPGTLRIFINPKILTYSEETWMRSEACLSIPGVYGDVERPIKIKVEYNDLEGNRLEQEFVGLEARIILHENDHINGVLYIDRVHGNERKRLEPILRMIKMKYSAKKSH